MMQMAAIICRMSTTTGRPNSRMVHLFTKFIAMATVAYRTAEPTDATTLTPCGS